VSPTGPPAPKPGLARPSEIDLAKSQGDFVLALGFGNHPEEAARNAIASLRDGFEKAKHDDIAGWQEWMKTHASLCGGGLAVVDAGP
jgi:glucoamylase